MLIPDLLVTYRGNISKVAMLVNCERSTVRKFHKDREGKKHIIVDVDGDLVLMTAGRQRDKSREHV